MYIAFNSLNSGLGNNGGTRTIIKCAEALRNLGHDCDILASVDNFTWFDHKPPINRIPKDLDAIIAAACSDVPYTLSTNIPKKAWYLRGHENWAMPDQALGKLYNSGIINITNSKGLQRLLATYGADSYVVYQGIDFEWWRDEKIRSNDKIRIGCLFQKKHTKRWQDFVKLSEILGTEEYEYLSIGASHPDTEFVTKSWANVDHDWLCRAYSSCHVWFAPTELEGLHNVPIEAALCGCLIICSDHPMNGMGFDYAFDNNTAMIYRARDIKHAASVIKDPNWDCIERMDNVLKHNIGTREDNMKKMISYLEVI